MHVHTCMHASAYLLMFIQGSRSGAVSAVATLLSHSLPVFTYLFGAMAAMTAPFTLRKPPGLHDVPSSSRVKILRAPGLV